jgi:hydroxymethylpyrimidine kinase/phosphomethylpyrimidine kinase/thiamine-phosphate diphosphorylase
MHSSETAATPGLIWLIGGSDCSALAGIQADLATAQDLAVPAATVITAVTAQHNAAVLAVNPVSGAVLQSQLDALTAEGQQLPTVIKIGLIPDTITLELLTEWLSRFKQAHPQVWLLLDPVQGASSGKALHQLNPAAFAPLLALTDVLTPNQPELRALAGLPSDADAQLAVQLLFATGVKAIWCKDGHGNDSDLREVLYLHPGAHPLFRDWPRQALTTSLSAKEPQTALLLEKPRLPGSWRGTGCSFATALGCALAQPMLLPDALVLASLYLQQCLQKPASPRRQLHRCGWPVTLTEPAALRLSGALAGAALPRSNQGFAALAQAPGIYPVVGSFSQLFAVAAAGIRTVQLRLKANDQAALRQELRAAIAFGQAHQLQLFINDHWQLALELGAYGVHLGQEDLLNADVGAIRQAGLRLGISTHGYLELLQALQLRPSYIALGHLFATPTKQMPSIPQGLRLIALQQQLCQQQQIPAVAIGGIDASHLPALRAMGLAGVAMVRAVVQSPDITATCQQLAARWQCEPTGPAQVKHGGCDAA